MLSAALAVLFFFSASVLFYQTAQGFGGGFGGGIGKALGGSIGGLSPGGLTALGTQLSRPSLRPPGVPGLPAGIPGGIPGGIPSLPGVGGIPGVPGTVPLSYLTGCPSCEKAVLAKEQIEWYEQAGLVGTVWFLNSFITEEFKQHQLHFMNIFWEDNILPALMLMTQQMTTVAMQQVQIFGSFLDANHQLETQRLFQTMQAQTQKDYQPSTELCEFGSSVKSLAASERKAEATAVIMSQRSLDRQLGSTATSGREGPSSDLESRIGQFKTTFCDPKDNNNGLSAFCGAGAAKKFQINRDIDYARTIEFPWTLDVDLTDGGEAASDDEAAVFALASNLFAHQVLFRPGPTAFGSREDAEITDMQKNYMDARSLVAKRSVAENSYNAIAAMKSQGSGGSREFLAAIMAELGVKQPQELLAMLGQSPSYYAQMEVLTKKIYQNPDFYTKLYDTPANVARKALAVQVAGLMLKFDMLKSHLRAEASKSVLLELDVMDAQDRAEKEFGAQTGDVDPAPELPASGSANGGMDFGAP